MAAAWQRLGVLLAGTEGACLILDRSRTVRRNFFLSSKLNHFNLGSCFDGAFVALSVVALAKLIPKGSSECLSLRATMGPYQRFFKRPFDLMIAAPALLLLSPLICGTALAVWLSLGSPVVFAQARPGLHGRLFRVLKFRTMTAECDTTGALLPDAQRMTRIGGWLRRFSLDELPQLVNVLWGEMSLIGPRPLLPEYLALYSSEQQRRHTVRPGITGWAQVHGRNATTWELRLAQDVWYVANVKLRTDLTILFGTVRKVLRSEGIHSTGHATMPAFTGSAKRTAGVGFEDATEATG